MYTFLDERFTMYNSTFFRYFRHLNVTEKNYFIVERLPFYRKTLHKQTSSCIRRRQYESFRL